MTDAAALFDERFHPDQVVTDLAAHRAARPLEVHGPAAACRHQGCTRRSTLAVHYANRLADTAVLCCPLHIEDALDELGLVGGGVVQLHRIGGDR